MKFSKELFVLIVTLTTIIRAETDLEDHSDYLNPVDGHDLDYQQEKDQDKRTVLSSHHGWAKHIGIHPAGFKYVLGFSPVNLRYVPVVSPLIKPPYYHHHHHQHHHVVKPSPIVLRPVRPIIHQSGWRPLVRPVVKPVVPIHVPPPVKPWPGWVKPVHVHPVAPVIPVKPPVHHVTVTKPVHVDVIKPVHVHKPVHYVPSKPLIPVAPAVPVASPFFEVTKPNFPVLPLGATFPAPVLHHLPSAAGVAIQPAPSVLEVHGHPHFVPAPQPALVPQPVIPPHTHIVSPVVPQPLVPLHHHHHLHHLHPHVQPIPEQHDVQVPHVHHINPHAHTHLHQPGVIQEIPGHNLLHSHVHHQSGAIPETHNHLHPHIHQPGVIQEIPNHLQPHFDSQQVPINPADDAQHHHQIPLPNQNPSVLFHQQVPGNVHHEYSHQVNTDHSNVYIQQNLDIPSIQPGQTDLQLPNHLPQHPNYLPEGRAFPDQYPQQEIFRPSIALEPPFTHK